MVTPPSVDVLVRVWIFLPYSEKTADLVDGMIALITDLYGGCTYSKPGFAGPFQGLWIEDGQEDSETDVAVDRDVTVIIADVGGRKHHALLQDLEVLKVLIQEVERAACIMFHRIERI